MFTMTVAGVDTFTIPKKCIMSTKFILDVPMDSEARTGDVGTTLIVEGKILSTVGGTSFNGTRELALWSVVPSKRSDCYRDVTLKNVRGDVVVREYNFPHAFVVDYSENFDDEEGVGVFTLQIKQKKDRVEHVTVNGGFLK